MRKFRQLFSLSITHQYYGGEADPNLLIQPTIATQKLINQYNFQTSLAKSALTFYSSKEEVNSYLDYLTTVSEQDCFEFEIIPTTDSFYNYTDVPNNFNGRFCYSQTSDSSEDQTIQLSIIDKELGDFKEFALVKVPFSYLKTIPINYRINLESRKTIWEYYIINRSGQDLGQARVADKKEKFTFQREVETQLENGQSAIPFIMQGDPIPMSLKANHRFNLVRRQTATTSLTQNTSKEKVIFKGLPIPRPQWISNQQKNGKSYTSSPIYVYV